MLEKDDLVKRKLEDRCKFAAVFAFMALILWSCKDDPNSTGLGILPGTDLATVDHVVEVETNKAFTHNDTILRTDGLLFNILGTFNDPKFGKTQADFACQFRIPQFPDFGENPQVDSLSLILLYKNMYGDTITPQSLKVYELESPIYTSKPGGGGTSVPVKYYQDVDLKALTSPIPIGELDFIPKLRLDSTERDTLIQELIINLDNSLAEKLIHADSLNMVSSDAFLEFFRGLYVETQDIANGGGLVYISTLSSGSALRLFYSNEEEDSLSFTYNINSNSARVSRFSHDYSMTDFATNLNSESIQDSLIYLQTMGGIRVKLELPFLDTWIDSTKTGINKAELIFQVDTVASDYPNLAVPNQIVLTAIDENGQQYLPSDFSISANLFGGRFDDDDNTYRFNITRHLQEIVNRERDNYGFYLSTAFRSIDARRVILKGATSQTGIRLEVTYTKYN